MIGGGVMSFCDRRGELLRCGLFGLYGLFGHRPSDVDEIVGYHTEPNPTLHSILTFIPTAIETVSPLGDADSSFASGAPFLAVAEPTLLLLTFALGTFGGTIGNADALDALCFGCCFIFGGVKSSVGCHQARRACEDLLMGFDGRNQKVGIAGPSIITSSRSQSGFPLPAILPSCRIIGLARLALANDF